MVLLSIGMSNTASEFERFIGEARRSPAVNRRLVIVNGALSSADAEMWAHPESMAWQRLGSALGRNTPAQVQAVWISRHT